MGATPGTTWTHVGPIAGDEHIVFNETSLIETPSGHLDGRVFLVYGYRHPPYGIRGRILDPECTSSDDQELVLRDDGGNTDIGYPWSCITADGQVLTVYCFNVQGGTRHIAGLFLEI